MRGDELDFLNQESRRYFSDLSEKIKNNEVVLFVGAGLSKNAHRRDNALNKKFPLWVDLTTKMLQKLYGGDTRKIEMEKYYYLEVADKYEAEFGRNSLIRLIEEMLKDSEFEPGDVHHLIGLFDWEIITTNYDTLIERGFELSNKVYNPIFSDSDLTSNEKPRIFKINGCIKHAREEIIITSEDFRTFSEKKPLIELYVKKFFVEATVLFVGFSLDDPAFKTIHGWVRDRLLQSRHNRFAYSVQVTVDEPTRKIWHSRGIRFIQLAPDGATTGDLVEKRLFSFLHALYKHQKEDSCLTTIRKPFPPPRHEERMNDLEKLLSDIFKNAEASKNKSNPLCPAEQAKLAEDFLACLKRTSIQDIFTQITGGSVNNHGDLQKARKFNELQEKCIYLLKNFFSDIQRNYIIVQLLREFINQMEGDGGRSFEDRRITKWVSHIFQQFFVNEEAGTYNSNIWIMALYIALRIGISQRLLPITFFREAFSVIRKSAQEGNIEQKVSKELHRFWLFSVIFAGNFKCADILLNISRKLEAQKYPWELGEYVHFHLEVFFDDHKKYRELFHRAVNKFKESNDDEALSKYFLLDTFLKKLDNDDNTSDLLLKRTYRELHGKFREQSQQYADAVKSIKVPLKEAGIKSAVQAVFNAVRQGKSFMFSGLFGIVPASPELTIEKHDIRKLKNSSLCPLFLLLLIYDKSRQDREQQLKRLITRFIDYRVIDISFLLDLLLLRLEDTELQKMQQNEDNGLSRYLGGLLTFIECALPYMDEAELFKVKDEIEKKLPQIKLDRIRERMVAIVGFILEQFTGEELKKFYRVLGAIFKLATQGQYTPVGLKHLRLINGELGQKDIVKYLQLRLILDHCLEKQGTPFERDFMDFLLKHKPHHLFNESRDKEVSEILQNHFAFMIREAREDLSFQWLMDLQQLREKGYVEPDNEMECIIKDFIKKAFENTRILLEWKIFSEKMIPVYRTFAEFFDELMMEQVIEEFHKNMQGKKLTIKDLDCQSLDKLAQLLKEIYYSKKHERLNDNILAKVKSIIKENHPGGGHLAAFWAQLKPGERTKQSNAVKKLWLPPSEENVIYAIDATGEFLKHTTDKPIVEELSNRLFYCIFSGSDKIKIAWLNVMTVHRSEETEWFKNHRAKVLQNLDYLKEEKQLDFLRDYVKLLEQFENKEVEHIVKHLKTNAPYAEIRRSASRLG